MKLLFFETLKDRFCFVVIEQLQEWVGWEISRFSDCQSVPTPYYGNGTAPPIIGSCCGASLFSLSTHLPPLEPALPPFPPVAPRLRRAPAPPVDLSSSSTADQQGRALHALCQQNIEYISVFEIDSLYSRIYIGFYLILWNAGKISLLNQEFR